MIADVSGGSPLTTTRAPEVDTPLTVVIKTCCGVLVGEECDCAAFAAEARGVFARPIFWDLRIESNGAAR
jgi:hypothetical protein